METVVTSGAEEVLLLGVSLLLASAGAAGGAVVWCVARALRGEFAKQTPPLEGGGVEGWRREPRMAEPSDQPST
jgi:hypothetical protein